MTEEAAVTPDLEIVAQNGEPTLGGLTVIVSLFNYACYIEECLDSVLAQTLADLELVVINDCSTDHSLSVVSSWCARNSGRFHRYVIGQHRQNRGLAATRNSALAHARTPYVLTLDADNALYPRCLQQLRSALDHCDAAFAYCYLEKFGKVASLQNTKPWDPAAFRYGNTIDAMVLHRRAVLEKVGGYSTDMPAMGWEDFDLWFKLARNHGWGIMVPEILARYRVHDRSMLLRTTNPNADKLWEYLQNKYSDLLVF